MTGEADIWAIVPAAGAGVRMQSDVPKQYLPLLGRPILLHSLDRLCRYPRMRGVLLGIAPDDRHWPTVPAPDYKTFLGTFTGGATRRQTVLRGLTALAAYAHTDDWVMVHDAVRPCVRTVDLDKLVAAALASPDGALLAVPVTDTVKRSGADGCVHDTIARAGLWRALTPQMFRLGRLREALSAVGERDDVTDESMAVERAGAHPRLVEGHADNIKVTLASDLVLAEWILARQAGAAA